ncbi:hypothetical protein M1394_00015 [Candidatus Marsarchaeota archaeon]|nr:hypothetical protein [Candidatus Marsarchaeota archaeon]
MIMKKIIPEYVKKRAILFFSAIFFVVSLSNINYDILNPLYLVNGIGGAIMFFYIMLMVALSKENEAKKKARKRDLIITFVLFIALVYYVSEIVVRTLVLSIPYEASQSYAAAVIMLMIMIVIANI